MGVAPRVAVCVPLYNKARFVATTIESVLAQTFTDFELVVLDNASTDGSGAIAAAYLTDDRVRLHRGDVTVPAPVNFQRCVALSTAPLVKILCADDVIAPTCLERQVEVLDADAAVALTAARQDMVDAEGDVVLADRGLRAHGMIGRHDGPSTLRGIARHGGNPVGADGSVLFRRDVYDATVTGEDYAFVTHDIQMWTAMLTGGDWFGSAETLAGFRRPEDADTQLLGLAWLRQQWRLAVSLGALEPTVRRRDMVRGCLRVSASFLRNNGRALGTRVVSRIGATRRRPRRS